MSMFENVTKVAIEEMIIGRSQASKFGYILTKENARDLVDDIFNLLLTSRNLKAAGDKMLQGGVAMPPTRGNKIKRVTE